jgi:hypothetical protein
MPVRPGPFYIFEIAQALTRQPGDIAIDRDKARAISDEMFDMYERGEFREEEVVVRYGNPPRIGTIAEAKKDAGDSWDEIHPNFWYAAVALTYPAAKRYVESCGLAGAERLLKQWFTEAATPDPMPPEPQGVSDNASDVEAAAPVTGKRKPGPEPKLRTNLCGKMLDDLRSGRHTPETLRATKMSALSSEYGASPNTAAEARNHALAQFSELQNLNSEKL